MVGNSPDDQNQVNIYTVHRPHGYAVGRGVLYYTWLVLQIYKISLYKHTRYVVTYNTNSLYRYIIIYQVLYIYMLANKVQCPLGNECIPNINLPQ